MKPANIFPYNGYLTTSLREKLTGHKAVVIWLTGLSGSGKSTIAYKLERDLFNTQILSYVLDGDNIRQGLNKDLNFTPDDRSENIRRIAEVSALFCNAGLITIVSFISPFVKDRAKAREIIGAERFIEVYVKASFEACEKRDPKGIYSKARSGEVINFTGITSEYEEPTTPDILINSESMTIDESVESIVSYLMARGTQTL